MRKPDLDAIRQREAAATAGPWRVGPEDPQFKDVLHPHELIISHQHGIVELEPSRNGAADTAFIAHARQDVPELLGALDEARGLIASLVGCAERLDASERHFVMRAEGCGWCGGDHLAELSALVTGSNPSGSEGGES